MAQHLESAPPQSPAPAPTAGYRPLPGTLDEMVAPDGSVRPLWRELIADLAAGGPERLARRFERADQHLRDEGVYYRVYGERSGAEREWPLAHVPVLIDDAEWLKIAEGLVQRAELLEAVVADIYGANRLVAEGLIPPALVAASPEFLRPLVGVQPAGGHFLHFCAFELGRGPDGRWWVLADRTQAPSGAGFALENRGATPLAFPELFTRLNVRRLAGFFRDFRDQLQRSAAELDGSVAIVTPGQHNETYFEHAYMARYLGFLLLEGEDLTVANGRLMVRTIAGLKPVGVLWRRLDAAFMDPLELNPQSQLGTPGLVQAVRAGAALAVNALGAGVLETRALLAFLPGISRHLTGEDLRLPHIATWWCGQRAEREHVAANLESMVLSPAYSGYPLFEDAEATIVPGALEAGERAALAERLAREGGRFVGQETVTLSTTPCWADGGLAPRPVALRAFVARTQDGWTVMPGGFARVGSTPDPAAIAMRRGGRAADVWVLAANPVERFSLLAEAGRAGPSAASLPSRAADNLYWLGRYIERTEGAVRVLRAYHQRLAEIGDPEAPLLKPVREHFLAMEAGAGGAIPDTLLAALDGAAASAARIRDRFSRDGWYALMDLAKTARAFKAAVGEGEDASSAATVLLRKLAGFSGLVHENMYRSEGWRFLEIGRRIERAIEVARLAALLTDPRTAGGAHEMLLEIGDSVMTHRHRYRAGSGRHSVVDLMVLDGANPRSLVFQLADVKRQLELLPRGSEDGRLSPAAREALRLHTELAIAAATDVTPERLREIAVAVGGLSDLIDRTYFR